MAVHSCRAWVAWVVWATVWLLALAVVVCAVPAEPDPIQTQANVQALAHAQTEVWGARSLMLPTPVEICCPRIATPNRAHSTNLCLREGKGKEGGEEGGRGGGGGVE